MQAGCLMLRERRAYAYDECEAGERVVYVCEGLGAHGAGEGQRAERPTRGSSGSDGGK